MQVDDDIFHFGIVDGALGRAAPGVLGLRIAVEQPDEVDAVQIDEVEALRVLDPAAEYQVKLAHGRLASSKCPRLRTGHRADQSLRTVPTAASAEALAALPAPSNIERRVSVPLSRVRPELVETGLAGVLGGADGAIWPCP